jgi:hypothetical protein
LNLRIIPFTQCPSFLLKKKEKTEVSCKKETQMLRGQILPFIVEYVEMVSNSLLQADASYRLTKTQRLWLCFCLGGILLTNSVCWTKFSRAGLGSWLDKSLSWMFRHSKINWEKLFQHSVQSILKKNNLTEGSLEIDDTERERSKNSKQIHHLGKQKDKKSGGYFMGQSIVFVLLVTKKISIPVGFEFYKMDSELKSWQEQDAKLKKQKVKKKDRPAEPERNPLYPTKNAIALKLVANFKADFSDFKVKAVKADALFGTAEFMNGVADLYPKSQIVSQIRSNQKIERNGKEEVVSEYFAGQTARKGTLVIRGGESVPIEYMSIRAKVKSHDKKRLIIALKYEGEEKFRYIIAKDMTWRVQDVLECFTLRWLVEVFFQDWKQYEGWGQLTKHVGDEGSRQSLTLSLLFDHCLLSHPMQSARIKDNLPLYTVGSLRDQLSIQSLLHVFKHILEQPNPKAHLEKLVENINKVYVLRTSSKHMSGRDPTWESPIG